MDDRKLKKYILEGIKRSLEIVYNCHQVILCDGE